MVGGLVSVIIPAYKAANTIARAVDSVLAQTHRALEVLVIDDGSPDDVAPALRPYGSRVALVRKPNGGAASARNLGMDLAKGEFVAFLDADDYWEPQKLERQLGTFGDRTDVGIVSSRSYTQAPGEPRRPPGPNADALLDRVLRTTDHDVLEIATRIWTSTVIVRRSVLGDQRFVSGLEPAEDRDLWARVVAQYAAYVHAEPLATAVLEPGSLSRSGIDRDCSNMLRVVHRQAALLGRRGLRKWEASTFGRWAGVHLANGDPTRAVKPAWRRCVRQPLSPDSWWILFKSLSLGLAGVRSQR